MSIHRVGPNDCVHSVAALFGHSWTTIWDHPNNAELKKEREAPTCLKAGDELFVPPINPRAARLRTTQSHRFVRKEVPHWLRLTFEDDRGKPRSGVEYELDVGGKVREGKTDPNGKLEAPIPTGATHARLRLFANDKRTGERYVAEEFSLAVGRLDPTRSVTGVKARLKNMGFYQGSVDDEVDGSFRDALRLFQEFEGLDVTGEIDDPTCGKLFAAHQR